MKGLYKRLIIAILLFSATHNCCIAQSDSIQHRIVLIGDAGELNFGRAPVIDAVKNLIPLNEKTTVIYLGDNLYNYGLPDDRMPDYQHLKAILDSQINIAKGTKAKVYFIPGNHDWSNEALDGTEIVKRQGAYVINSGNSNVHFYPQDGCPGPIAQPINDDITLVMYDSQWFIRKQGTKPGIESDCDSKTPDQFYAELKDILDRNSDKLVILAGHHTLRSYGTHGGYFPVKLLLFPLMDINVKVPIPLIGFIYILARGTFGTPEDLRFPAYENMIKGVDSIAKKHPNVIFVGGHEHTLQLIKDSSYYYVVSGAGSKHTRLNSGKKLLYGADSLGFSTLEISKNKNVHADFYTVTEKAVKHSFSRDLFNFSSIVKSSEDSAAKIPDAKPIMHFEDSVTVAVNANYLDVSSFHKFILGRNYRKHWAMPVHLKVFRIDKENGGYTITGIGGGKQTKSLSLKDKDGNEWKLRTVDKNPEGLVAQELKSLVPQEIIQDMISAEHPYAALAIPALAEAAGVAHTSPTYYYVPDDPALGIYQTDFAKKVCLLERDDPTSNEDKTKSTAKIIDKILEDSKNHIDQEAVLRARLLDMMIGDWDRHFDQWKFGTNDTGAGKLYYPVPRDRDEAFFNSNAPFFRTLSLAALPFLQGFKKHFYNIKWFNWEERNFDRLFMNNLDADAWKRIIKDFQANETDSVINNAVKQMPPKIYALDKKIIPEKLKTRRDLLGAAGLRYYRFLAKEVNILGSNKNEYFKLFNSGDDLQIKVYKSKKSGDTSNVMFDRTFHFRDTKYINLYGLNGNDNFEIDSTADSKIKLRIIGGRGKDTFNIKGNVRNRIYDYAPDTNYIANARKSNIEISSDPQVNNFDIAGYNYNSYRLPLLAISFNEEDKFLAGIGYSYKTYSFRKEPYSTYQRVSALLSFKTGAYQAKYSGEFNQRVGKFDILVNGQVYNTVLNNFYGFGNETKKDSANIFYNVRYSNVAGDVLFRKRSPSGHLQFYVGPSYFHYWNNNFRNKQNILSHPALAGLDSTSIYSNKSYAGVKTGFTFNNFNKEFLPTRGVLFNAELTSLAGLNDDSHKITRLTTDLTLHSSFNDPTRIIFVLRFGYGHIFNKNYEYFQALTLGSNNYLRGFTKDRFAGKSRLYNSFEVRYKLFASKFYLIPGDVGLLGFNDVGRVWVKEGTSHKWHDSFGGGLYFSPFNFAIVSATMAFSGEGSLFNFSVGTKFNITY